MSYKLTAGVLGRRRRDKKVIPNVGDFYEGGVVVYYLEPDDFGYDANIIKGLIAIDPDVNPITSFIARQWGCQGLLVGGTSTNIGTGFNNSQLIINAHTGWQSPYDDETENGLGVTCNINNNGSVSAKYVSELTINGYSDWFLPSRFELLKLHNDIVIAGLRTYQSVFLHSSTESSSINNNVVNVATGQVILTASKINGFRTVPFRNFGL